MPDLSQAAVHQFWNEFDDPFIYRVISFMESVEDWTQDGDPQLEAALQKLGDQLDDMGSIELEQEKDIIKQSNYKNSIKCIWSYSNGWNFSVIWFCSQHMDNFCKKTYRNRS